MLFFAQIVNKNFSISRHIICSSHKATLYFEKNIVGCVLLEFSGEFLCTVGTLNHFLTPRVGHLNTEILSEIKLSIHNLSCSFLQILLRFSSFPPSSLLFPLPPPSHPPSLLPLIPPPSSLSSTLPPPSHPPSLLPLIHPLSSLSSPLPPPSHPPPSQRPHSDRCVMFTGSDTGLAEDSKLEERSFRPIRQALSAEQQFGRSTDELNIVADVSMGENCLECQNVPLKYGENNYHLTIQVPGSTVTDSSLLMFHLITPYILLVLDFRSVPFPSHCLCIYVFLLFLYICPLLRFFRVNLPRVSHQRSWNFVSFLKTDS